MVGETTLFGGLKQANSRAGKNWRKRGGWFSDREERGIEELRSGDLEGWGRKTEDHRSPRQFRGR